MSLLADVLAFLTRQHVPAAVIGGVALAAQRIKIVNVHGISLPLVDRADLILLKLLAGGPQDLLDVELLVASDPVALRAEVESRVATVPAALSTACGNC